MRIAKSFVAAVTFLLAPALLHGFLFATLVDLGISGFSTAFFGFYSHQTHLLRDMFAQTPIFAHVYCLSIAVTALCWARRQNRRTVAGMGCAALYLAVAGDFPFDFVQQELLSAAFDIGSPLLALAYFLLAVFPALLAVWIVWRELLPCRRNLVEAH